MKKNFAILDGIRGIAALFVLILHTDNYWAGLTFKYSHLAVDIFFILSGYVIAHAYEDKLALGKLTLKDFVLIRLIRLYPMFFISIFFAAAVILLKYANGGSQNSDYLFSIFISIGLTFFLSPSILPNNIILFPLNGVYWSIFYELLINFFFALTRPVLSNKILILLITILAILMTLIVFLKGTLSTGFTWRVTSIISGLVRSGFGIFFGIFLYRLGKNFKPNSTLPTWSVVSLPTMILAMPDLGVFSGIFELFAVFIIFPLSIIYGTRCCCNQLTTAVFKVLGQVSYPMYLLHVPIAALVYSFGFGSLVERFAPVSGLLLVISIILFALLLEKFYDLPLRKYLSHRYSNSA